MNKEGQEGLSLGTLLMIILGVVVLVVLVLGFTGAFDFIFRQTDQLPQALESAVQGCKVAAQGSFVTSFCYEFRDIGSDQYVNCQDRRILDSLDQQEIDYSGITCNPGIVTDSKINLCDKDIRNSSRDEVYFNNNPSDLCNTYIDETGFLLRGRSTNQGSPPPSN